MAISKEQARKVRQATREGDEHRSITISAAPTTDTIEFSIVAEKVSYQAIDPLMTATVTVSADGINFIAGTDLTAGAIITYSAHMIKAIKFVRTAGAGQIVVLAR